MVLREVNLFKAYEEEEYFDEEPKNSSIKVENSVCVPKNFIQKHETNLNYINMET